MSLCRCICTRILGFGNEVRSASATSTECQCQQYALSFPRLIFTSFAYLPIATATTYLDGQGHGHQTAKASPSSLATAALYRARFPHTGVISHIWNAVVHNHPKMCITDWRGTFDATARCTSTTSGASCTQEEDHYEERAIDQSRGGRASWYLPPNCPTFQLKGANMG